MTTTSVTFEIDSKAVNYAATLEKDGKLIDSIDKNSGGKEVKALKPGSYEARVYFRGKKGTTVEVKVTVGDKPPVSKKFEIKNDNQTEARGGVSFVVEAAGADK
jgi:hypothetical protein